MSRNHTKLRVFHLADELVVLVYRLTSGFPPDERYGLRSQLRRASLSAPTNIVEGCSRETTREYCRYLRVSMGSANECEYLLRVAARLGFVQSHQVEECCDRYNELARSLQKMLDAFPSASRGTREVGAGDR